MPKVQRSRSIAVAALAAVTVLGLASAVALAETKTVTIAGTTTFSFRPASLTVTVGDTVEWKNTTEAPHTVTSDAGGPLDGGGNYTFTFDTAGTFAYHCNFHPNMQGTVVVEAAAPGGGGGEATPPPTDASPVDGSTDGQTPLPLLLGMLTIAIGAALLAVRRLSAVRISRD